VASWNNISLFLLLLLLFLPLRRHHGNQISPVMDRNRNGMQGKRGRRKRAKTKRMKKKGKGGGERERKRDGPEGSPRLSLSPRCREPSRPRFALSVKRKQPEITEQPIDVIVSALPSHQKKRRNREESSGPVKFDPRGNLLGAISSCSSSSRDSERTGRSSASRRFPISKYL